MNKLWIYFNHIRWWFYLYSGVGCEFIKYVDHISLLHRRFWNWNVCVKKILHKTIVFRNGKCVKDENEFLKKYQVAKFQTLIKKNKKECQVV